jgi:hypothetical protein
MRRKSLLFGTLLFGLLLSACGSVKIGRILADPSRYRNRTVQVDGTVTNAFGALGAGGYQVEDETGKIYVISRTGVPTKGSRVKVSGTVMNGVNVMGRAYGTAIREQNHKVRW